jgi:cobalt/nickel transport system permease protein
MHHVVLDRWSRGDSWLHRRDPRAKLVATLALLVAIATASRPFWLFAASVATLLSLLTLAAGLPLLSLLSRALAVLPFSAAFALISWLGGDSWRAWLLVSKSYLSAVAVLLFAGVTPAPALLHALERLAAPRFLLLVMQFLYRYLFVLSEEAQHMRAAAAARGMSELRHARRAAAGSVAGLFLRSYERAQAIHHAMLARGFDGSVRMLRPARFSAADALFAAAAIVGVSALRMAAGMWP